MPGQGQRISYCGGTRTSRANPCGHPWWLKRRPAEASPMHGRQTGNAEEHEQPTRAEGDAHE